jgi:hypothetical protein
MSVSLCLAYFLCLRIMSSRFSHMADIRISFPVKADHSSIVWINHILFIQSLVDTWVVSTSFGYCE